MAENKIIKIDTSLSKEILTKMFAGICIIGLEDSLIKYVSPRFIEMFSAKAEDFLEKSASLVGVPVDGETHQISKEIISHIKKNEYWRGNLKNKKKDGSELYCDVKFWFFDHNTYGKILFGIYLDISKNKKIENEVEEKIKELEKINRLMVGRELKMVELKEKIKKMENKPFDSTQSKKNKI